MANERLFLELAQALGQPSRAYRAAQEGLAIPGKAMEGYDQGADFMGRIRNRRNAQMSLRDVLGDNVPERFSKVAGIPQEQIRDFAPLDRLSDEPVYDDALKRELIQARIDALRNPRPPTEKPTDPLDAELKRARIDALRRGPSGPDTKENAMGGVSEKLKTMRSYYQDLNDMKAITNTDNGRLSNLSASVRSSGPGQLTGQAFGTKEQSMRNQIKMMQPLLIQDIRKASAMGARGLDSEKELAFYLRAASDPSLDLQSNLQALEVLDKAYGLGGGSGGASRGQKVKVSNGQETLEIDPTDIPNAVQDGYRPIQ